MVAVEPANAKERLLKAETDFQRQLRRERTKETDTFQHTVLERDKTIDQQLTQLRHLTAVNLDPCGDLAEAKAQTTGLRLEVARILRRQRGDTQDLMRLAARLLQLSDHLGIPLDQATRDVYRRRGWPTILPARAMTVSIARRTAHIDVKYLLKTTMRDDVPLAPGHASGYYLKAGTPPGRKASTAHPWTQSRTATPAPSSPTPNTRTRTSRLAAPMAKPASRTATARKSTAPPLPDLA